MKQESIKEASLMNDYTLNQEGCFIMLPVGYKAEYFTEKQLRDLQSKLLKGYRFSDRDVSLLDAILSYMAVNVLVKQ